MKYDPNKHHRRSIRLWGYDYSQSGAYFITLCTHERRCLFGEIINGQMQLNELGFDVYYHFSVGDNAQRLKDILEYALERSDLLITTGGLGPTQDDLTKETINSLALADLPFSFCR